MNAAAFFITLTLHLPMQIQPTSLVSKKAHSVVRLKDSKVKKPPCGPVRFPDISCEEVTTCVTVTTETRKQGGKNLKNDGHLHNRYETTCMMIDLLKKSALGHGPVPTRTEKSVLRQGLDPAGTEKSALRHGLEPAGTEKSALSQGLEPAGTEKSVLRQGPGSAGIEKSLLRLGPDMIIRQRPLTTSTVAPYAGGTTPKQMDMPVDDIRCKGMANCHQWNWKK